MKFCPRPVFVLLLLATALQARTWPIARYETTVRVGEDGSAVVSERFQFVFVPAPGKPSALVQFFLKDEIPDRVFLRRIDLNPVGATGRRQTRIVHLLWVATDGDDRAPYQARTRDDVLEISVPVAPGPGHTVEIQYAVRNAVSFLAGEDELYWTVANQFGINLGATAVRIFLPPAIESKMRTQAFVVGGGPIQPLSPEVSGASLALETSALPQGKVIAADVVVPKGLFREPAAWRRAGWWLRGNPIVLMPLVVFAFMYWLWRTKARNYLPGLSVAPRYGPPEGLTPAEVGTLVDDRVDPRDITSTLVDLAVRGYVRIEEAAPQEGFFSDAPDYIFRLLKPREEWGGLVAHERTMLFHMFYGGHWTMLSSLRLRFPVIAQSLKTEVMDALKRKGMYRVPPELAPAFRLLGFGVIAALALGAEVTGALPLYRAVAPAVVAIAISAVVVHLFSRRMTAKTFKGLRAYTEIRGFQEYIEIVEADRLARTAPASFEKFLPYAMALGIEHRWSSAFRGIVTEPPGWYQFASGITFDSVIFGDRLSHMGSQARAAMLSRSRFSGTPPEPAQAAQAARS
jgi:hypothetical protein